jgi:MFS transporter, DHA2 family, multidrug resistance protein
MSLSRKFAAFVVDLTDLVIGGEPIVRRRSGPRPPPIFKHPSHCLRGHGIGLFAVAMYLTATLTNQAGFAELLVPQVLRRMALMMCYIPANLIALSSVPQDKLKNAAGLYNLTRDLGGAIVLATIGTLMNDRLHFHWNRLIEDINPARPAVQHFLDMQSGRLETLVPGDAGRAAVRLLANLVQREALVMTYNDALLLIGGLFVAALFVMPLVRRPRATPVSPGH